jgi:hypothetical protein
MAWKLSIVLAFAIAWLAAPAVRAESDTRNAAITTACAESGGYAFEDFDRNSNNAPM